MTWVHQHDTGWMDSNFQIRKLEENKTCRKKIHNIFYVLLSGQVWPMGKQVKKIFDTCK